MRTLILTITATLTIAVSSTAQAFCGFYVARADTSLYNQASQVVLVRDGDRTVITMANDFQGDVEDFAVVIPVPTFIEREQINVADNALIEHLDAYTAPRLVEYHDPDPCSIYDREEMALKSSMPRSAVGDAAFEDGRARGVTIEASYSVGEYDILILSADESSGLIQWLGENDYKIPQGAEKIVDSYLKQDMRFFRRQSEPGRTVQPWLLQFAAATSRLRKQQVHVADSLGHLKCEGQTGVVRLCTHQDGSC